MLSLLAAACTSFCYGASPVIRTVSVLSSVQAFAEVAGADDEGVAAGATWRSRPLPAKLVEWGCDEALWKQIKHKRGLIKLASEGDEDHGRRRLLKLRQLIDQGSTGLELKAPKKAIVRREPSVPETTTRIQPLASTTAPRAPAGFEWGATF